MIEHSSQLGSLARRLTLTLCFAATLIATVTTPASISETNASVPERASTPSTANDAARPQAAVPAGTIVDGHGTKITPTNLQCVGDDIYFLTPRSLWCVTHAGTHLRAGEGFTANELKPPAKFSNVPLQEFCNFAYVPARDSLIVLDKSGDLYEYGITARKWRLFRSNLPFVPKQPDPHFIDLCAYGKGVLLLDPERNEIWKVSSGATVIPGLFPLMFPWQAKPGDVALGDAVAIASDGQIYVVRRYGGLTVYGDGDGKSVPQAPFHYALRGKHAPLRVRASRMVTAPGTPLFVIERENNRVLAIDKATHAASQFLFSETSDLRGLIPRADGFYILNRGQLEHRALSKPSPSTTQAIARKMDSRLRGMVMPIPGMRLPRHTGVFPGARRLYRYGVHEGLDLFYDAGAKTKVKIGTPVVAVKDGTLTRVDANHKEMTATQFNRLLYECLRDHRTSEKNEDLLRGCQVWIDHGRGLMTRYAHLSKINSVLSPKGFVKAGDLIGSVGISGTGQNLPGRQQFPHLHFEIWLDGHYLGFGFTPIETMQAYEDIFGRN